MWQLTNFSCAVSRKDLKSADSHRYDAKIYDITLKFLSCSANDELLLCVSTNMGAVTGKFSLSHIQLCRSVNHSMDNWKLVTQC